MNVKRDEVFFDKGRQTGIGVRLLFEPQTGSSTGGRAEVDQQRYILGFCAFKRRVGICGPTNRHIYLRSIIANYTMRPVPAFRLKAYAIRAIVLKNVTPETSEERLRFP